MSYPQFLTASFGTSKAGLLTVGYQLFDSAGIPSGSRVTAGVQDLGSGGYGALVTAPDSFRGRIVWDTGELTPAYASEAINPQQSENPDVKTSTRSSHAPGDIWTNSPRTLTSYGTLIDDIVAALAGTAITLPPAVTVNPGPLLTADLPGAVRAALDPSLDETGLPDDIIFLPLYAEDAAAEVIQRDPNAVLYTDDVQRQRVLSATALLTAARIAPVLPQITQFQEGDFRYTLPTYQGDKIAALLRGRAATLIAQNVAVAGVVPPLEGFWLAAGRRGF
jgi:hypothetical protein